MYVCVYLEMCVCVCMYVCDTSVAVARYSLWTISLIAAFRLTFGYASLSLFFSLSENVGNRWQSKRKYSGTSTSVQTKSFSKSLLKQFKAKQINLRFIFRQIENNNWLNGQRMFFANICEIYLSICMRNFSSSSRHMCATTRWTCSSIIYKNLFSYLKFSFFSIFMSCLFFWNAKTKIDWHTTTYTKHKFKVMQSKVVSTKTYLYFLLFLFKVHKIIISV